MQPVNTYYHPSGKLPAAGIVWMLVFGALGALILGFMYGYAIRYMPFIIVSVLITLGYGFFIGALVGQGGKVGKVRNLAALTAFGFLGGLMAEYTAWVFWTYAATRREILPFNPLELLAVMTAFAEKGSWSLRSLTPTGIFLWIVWGLEALIIIGCSAFMARSFVSGDPFCESCDRWVDKPRVITSLTPLADGPAVKMDIEGGRFDGLTGLKKAEATSPASTTIELLQCDGCHLFQLLAVKSVVIKKDKAGKDEKQETTHVRNFIIDGGAHAALCKLG